MHLKKFKDCNLVCIPIECGTKLHKYHEKKKVNNTYLKQIVGNLIEFD